MIASPPKHQGNAIVSTDTNDFRSALRPTARTLPESGISKVFNYGRYKEGLIPLWAGEGDLPTPKFICDAAAKSMAAGETFYTAQRGIPDLRNSLARYFTRIYGQPFQPDEFFVTGGGMQAVTKNSSGCMPVAACRRCNSPCKPRAAPATR